MWFIYLSAVFLVIFTGFFGWLLVQSITFDKETKHYYDREDMKW